MKVKNKIYTAADIARYHSGTMPASEMHALEKAALEDPFLEDALEGYVHASAVESDIEELQARLAEKRKKKNVFFISSFAQNKWWRIAALFITMAGAGYFFYRINYDNKENSLAKNEIKTSPENKESAASIKIDSATTKNDVAFENQQASGITQKEKTTLSAATPRPGKEVTVREQKAEPVSPPGVDTRSREGFYTDSSYSKQANKENDTQLATGYLLKGKVTDEKGNAVPNASITNKALNKVTITDTAGRFILRSRDSSITAMASAPGYKSKSFNLKKDAQPTISMNKTEAELTEVVVTAYDRRKKSIKSDSESSALNEQVSGVQITTAGLQPSGGQEKFDQYLEENVTPTYDENNKLLKGEVLLSFTINKKGRPKSIKVLKSSCEACESDAIKLLQNGPDWIGKKDTPGTVVIKF